MGDKFHKVMPGDPLKIPAEAWNALVDLSQAQKNQQHDLLSQAEGTSKQNNLAKVRNQTGVDLDRFSIVALGTPIITPTVNLLEFKRQISFQGLVPSAVTGSRFGVLLEPLKNNTIGTAALGGCVITRISVGINAYNCAETVAGQNGYLRSVPHGPASVLWIESTGSVRWAVIRFDDANYEEIVFITSNIPDGNGYYPGVVQKFDVTTKAWNTAFDCKVVDEQQDRAELALRIDEAVRHHAPADWKGDETRERQVLNILFPLLNRNREATQALFEIIKNQAGY